MLLAGIVGIVRAIILGTGPSVTPEVIDRVNASGLPVFGCNNVYQTVDVVALMACNIEWWNFYWPRDERLRSGKFRKWTWDKATADRYGTGYIRGEWGDGLSTDPSYIHYGHSSGYQLLGIAYHAGVREMLLVGYDLRYPAGYSKPERKPGGDRHYFGEYPPQLQHFPSVGPAGEMTGLLECYRTIKPEDYGLRIINCTPGSALRCFEAGDLSDYLISVSPIV